jgi:hypothetical protein
MSDFVNLPRPSGKQGGAGTLPVRKQTPKERKIIPVPAVEAAKEAAEEKEQVSKQTILESHEDESLREKPNSALVRSSTASSALSETEPSTGGTSTKPTTAGSMGLEPHLEDADLSAEAEEDGREAREEKKKE